MDTINVELFGRDPKIQKAISIAKNVAVTKAPVLIVGEIGVGKKKKKLVYEQPVQKEVNALKYELQLFMDSILKNEEPVVSGNDGLRALKVAKSIIKP